MTVTHVQTVPSPTKQRRAFPTVIVGSSTLFREGLAQILSQAGFRVFALQSMTTDLPPEARSPSKPVLLIVDASNDPDSVIGEIALFKADRPAARVAVLAEYVNLHAAISAFRAGAGAYFLKNSTPHAVVNVLDLIMQGETILLAGALLPTVLGPIDYKGESDDACYSINTGGISKAPAFLSESNNAGIPKLSARERCILQYLILGDSNKAIARKTDTMEATVKVHVKAILRKIRAQNRTQAAIWAMKNPSHFSIEGTSLMTDAAAPPKIAALVSGRKIASELPAADD